MRLVKSNILLRLVYNTLVNYPVPFTISYFWNMGILAGCCLMVQIVTGIFLAMYYVPNSDYAFLSVEGIMRNINNGWFLRYAHMHGASFFFVAVYLHILRNMFYLSYLTPREPLWCTGVVLFVVMILTAFLGYVLPWGQMSFWAATVITSLFSVVPLFGSMIVVWLWGGYAVDTATLNRFFSLHFVMPFVILFLVLVHVAYLHEDGSTMPLGVHSFKDKIAFHPYFTFKDALFVIIMFYFVIYYIMGMPDVVTHSDNYIKANPLVTPTHIVPEWYFLIFYAILRSMPDKVLGIVFLAAAILILIVFPFFFPRVALRGAIFRPLHRLCFWLFVVVCYALGCIGAKPIEFPYFEMGQFFTLLYFLYFLVMLYFAQIVDLFYVYLFGLIYKFNVIYRVCGYSVFNIAIVIAKEWYIYRDIAYPVYKKRESQKGDLGERALNPHVLWDNTWVKPNVKRVKDTYQTWKNAK